jgi:two-component system, OmpR family, alkaline phosphatase synthesis response regulator PhoP
MAKEKILIVEDEKDLVNLVKYNFEKEGYPVISATNAESGLTAARKQKPDLIILDVMLPKMDGTEFCRIFRQESQTPIIFLTSKKNELDRILGLKLGADDYITKPFSIRELIARVETVFRRLSVSESSNQGKKMVKIGELAVDFERHEVYVKGKFSNLPPKEFELLKLFIQAKGKVLSREELLEKIWGYDNAPEIDTRTVDQHVARLRKRLQSERDRIATVANFGYQIKMNSNYINPLVVKKNLNRHPRSAAASSR